MTTLEYVLSAPIYGYDLEGRLTLGPEPASNPTPSKRQLKDRSGRTSRKRYGWRNANRRKCPVYSIIL